MGYAIGTKFKTGGKHPRECVVVDIYKTYNNAGDLVRTSYVATHEFLGKTMTNYDVPLSTIARGLMNQ